MGSGKGPILVGHHSERRARKDAERIRAGMIAGCESQDMAKHHRSKTAGIEQQLKRTIFSDDPDAPERLGERIAMLEAKRIRMKEINAEIRKGDGWVERLVLTEGEKKELANLPPRNFFGLPSPVRFSGKVGYPAYTVTNLGTNIRRLKNRLALVKLQANRARKAEEAGGIMIEVFADKQFPDDKFVTVTFAEKPARKILDALKAARFWWSCGKWTGRESDLPECIRELTKETQNETR